MTVEEKIEEAGYKDVIIFKNPDYEDAFIGVDINNRAVYDFDLMVESLRKEDGMNETDAIDFIEYNTVRSLPYIGKNAPVILYRC